MQFGYITSDFMTAETTRCGSGCLVRRSEEHADAVLPWENARLAHVARHVPAAQPDVLTPIHRAIPVLILPATRNMILCANARHGRL